MGRRDRVLLATMYNTGARVSEMVGLTVGDFTLTDTAAIRIHGKGRMERIVPLWRAIAQQIRTWSLLAQGPKICVLGVNGGDCRHYGEVENDSGARDSGGTSAAWERSSMLSQ
ncbi:MAG: tyrosine-type recombinase/integrase [Bryobacteraceae bacterium]